MKNKIKEQIFDSVAVLLLLIALVGSVKAASSPGQEAQKAASQLGADYVVEIAFSPGQYDLKAGESEDIKRAVNEVRRKGPIEKVKIAVWADTTQPNRKEAVQESTVRLADRRAQEIRGYLLQELNVSKVETYNMVEKPSALEDLFRTDRAAMGKALAKKEARTPSKSDVGLQYDGKASTALIFDINLR